jgi:hypothetical protein
MKKNLINSVKKLSEKEFNEIIKKLKINIITITMTKDDKPKPKKCD